MSTKAIREMITQFRSLAYHAEWDETDAKHFIDGATAEVEAIERAAKAATGVGVPRLELWTATMGLMESIAKDAP